MTIYKSFISPHLDYGDAIYDQASNKSFHQSLESLRYSAAIAITGVIRGTLSEKFFQDLGLETLKLKRWLRKFCLFYKLIKENSATYLFQITPTILTRSTQKSQIPKSRQKQTFSKILYFLQLYCS